MPFSYTRVYSNLLTLSLPPFHLLNFQALSVQSSVSHSLIFFLCFGVSFFEDLWRHKRKQQIELTLSNFFGAESSQSRLLIFRGSKNGFFYRSTKIIQKAPKPLKELKKLNYKMQEDVRNHPCLPWHPLGVIGMYILWKAEHFSENVDYSRLQPHRFTSHKTLPWLTKGINLRNIEMTICLDCGKIHRRIATRRVNI